MTHLSCYGDTDRVIQKLCDVWDMTEPEVIDELISIASANDDDVHDAADGII